MKNKLKLILFLFLVVLKVNAEAIDSTTNSISKLAICDSDINPDSIKLHCDLRMEFNPEGIDCSRILELMLIINDNDALFMTQTSEEYFDKKYTQVKLNKNVTYLLKTLLYDLYSKHDSGIKNEYIGANHLIITARFNWKMELSIGNKKITDFIDLSGYSASFKDPFNPQFHRIGELIIAIKREIERDIYKFKDINYKPKEWITEMFHGEFYEPHNGGNSKHNNL